MDVIGVARSGFLIEKHPEDDNLRVIAHVKHNLTPPGESYVFRLAKKAGRKTPAVEFVETTSLTADDLLCSPQDHGAKREEAWEFLKDQLKAGPRPSADIHAAAKEVGISPRTLERTKRDRGVESRKDGARWFLSLPTE